MGPTLLDAPPLHVFLGCGQKETRLAPPTGSLPPFRETNKSRYVPVELAERYERTVGRKREGWGDFKEKVGDSP